MSNSSSKHSKQRGTRQYFINTLCYLAILLAITVLTVFAAIKPVSELVHRVEAYVPMEARDIELNDSAYSPLSADSADELRFHYGDKIAEITSDDFRLNCAVYYGSNRISMGSGAGFSGETDLFGVNGTSVVAGYIESYFSGVEHCEIDDVITVTSNYGSFEYRVTDMKYIANDKEAYKENDDERLVLKAICSDFSEHGGESLYVFASRVNGEVR